MVPCIKTTQRYFGFTTVFFWVKMIGDLSLKQHKEQFQSHYARTHGLEQNSVKACFTVCAGDLQAEGDNSGVSMDVEEGMDVEQVDMMDVEQDDLDPAGNTTDHSETEDGGEDAGEDGGADNSLYTPTQIRFVFTSYHMIMILLLLELDHTTVLADQNCPL